MQNRRIMPQTILMAAGDTDSRCAEVMLRGEKA